MKLLTYLFGVTLICFSCDPNWILTDYSDQQSKAQSKAENSISQYLDSTVQKHFQYRPYLFGDLNAIKTSEVTTLDSLIDLRESLKNNPEFVDVIYLVELSNQIEKQKALVKRQNIPPIYKMDHLFGLMDSTGNLILMDGEFSMQLNTAVFDVNTTDRFVLNSDNVDPFEQFIGKQPMFKFEDEQMENEYNAQFHETYLQVFENETSDREHILSSIIELLKYIKLTNDFAPEGVCTYMAKKWLSENCNSNIVGRVSKLSSIKEAEETQGYYLFIEHSCTNPKEEAVVDYIQLDKFFIVRNASRMAPPYEEYFIPSDERNK